MEHHEGTFSGLKTMQLNDQKAGMEGLDKEEINRIIYEASKGTPFFAFQEKRQKSIDSKVNELQMKLKTISDSDRRNSLKKMDALCENLEKERDLSHSIVHIDMDAFFAAVEMRDNPELKDKPMAVGSSSMLSTSNYHARKYGVRAAMAGFIAKKLCPQLIIVPQNFEKYRAVGHEIRKIVEEYDPHYSASSLDEVYFDLTEYIKNKHRKKLHEEYCLKNDICEAFEDETANNDCTDNYGNCMGCVEVISDEARDKMAYDIVNEIRQRIFDVTQLTASAGIAPNTMLAKVCSDQNKPNGQYQICSTAEAVKSFIATLPVKKISGIGPVQGQILNSVGILTCADMWSKRDLVCNLFSPNSIEFYMEVGLGIGSTTVKSDYKRKSIGNEKTFKEIHEPEDLHQKCKELCDDLIEDLKPRNLRGKVIVLKIKTASFETHTRNYSLQYYTDDPEVIYKAAKKLLDAEIATAAPQPLRLRLMGIRMCNLVNEDSVSKNLKQPPTLKSFLQSKTAKSASKFKQTFTCPVCLKENKSTFNLFNEHVNDCIKTQNFSDTEEEILQDSVRNANACRNTEKQHILLKPLLQSKTIGPSTSKETFFCSVCTEKFETSLEVFSNHMSKCMKNQNFREAVETSVSYSARNTVSHTETQSCSSNTDSSKFDMVYTDSPFKSEKPVVAFKSSWQSNLRNTDTCVEASSCNNSPNSKRLHEYLSDEDFESNWEKQHTSFTSSPSKSDEGFTCPICLEAYEASFSSFSDHVNNCVKIQNFKNEEAESSAQDSTRDMYMETDDVPCSVSSTFLCPVCGLNPHVTNLTELNIHVDKCLNKKAIKEILADELKVPCKRKINFQKGSSKRIKESKKERRIDEYFQLNTI